jgi:DNA-binding response OmpR family regulator
VEIPPKQPTLLLIGNDTQLGYLLQRYAEQSQYPVAIHPANLSTKGIEAQTLMAVVFLSIELLEASQELVGQLTTGDIPVVVCASAADEVRARELGADNCLLHPVTYNDFQTVLAAINGSKQPLSS